MSTSGFWLPNGQSVRYLHPLACFQISCKLNGQRRPSCHTFCKRRGFSFSACQSCRLRCALIIMSIILLLTLKVFTRTGSLKDHPFARSIVHLSLSQMNNFSPEVVAHPLVLGEALRGQLLWSASDLIANLLDDVKAIFICVVLNFHVAQGGGEFVEQEIGPV